MKQFVILFSMMFGFITFAFSQTKTTDTISLKDLETPTSPAFMLLDQTPTTIEHPNSSKAFVASVLNTFNTTTGLPQNYAVDFTPFWFVKHPNLTSLSYMGYNADKHKQKIFGNLKLASISFAYITSTDSITKNQINNVAIGLRFNLITIRSKKDIEDLLAANLKAVSLLKELDGGLDAYVDRGLIVTDSALYHKKVQKYYADLASKPAQKNDLRDILNRKPVFTLDGAVGYNNFFLDNNYSNSHFGRFGAWTTLNYAKNLDSLSSDYINFYALGRYISDGTVLVNNKYTTQNYYDFGGKLEFEFRNLSIGYEYIYRSNDLTGTFRSNGQIKYKVSDQVILTGAFGKNFGTNNNLISLLGINWGISTGNEQATIK